MSARVADHVSRTMRANGPSKLVLDHSLVWWCNVGVALNLNAILTVVRRLKHPDLQLTPDPHDGPSVMYSLNGVIIIYWPSGIVEMCDINHKNHEATMRHVTAVLAMSNSVIRAKA